MDINDAVNQVEAFLETFKSDNDDWNPTEIRVLPSGDDVDHIKITINFGPDAADGEIEGLKDRAIEALKKAHPAIAGEYTFDARALND